MRYPVPVLHSETKSFRVRASLRASGLAPFGVLSLIKLKVKAYQMQPSSSKEEEKTRTVRQAKREASHSISRAAKLAEEDSEQS